MSFDNGGEFIRETRREVELYLQSRWTRVRGYLELYAKTVVAFGLMVASWTTLIFLSPGIWLGFLCLVALAAVPLRACGTTEYRGLLPLARASSSR